MFLESAKKKSDYRVRGKYAENSLWKIYVPRKSLDGGKLLSLS